MRKLILLIGTTLYTLVAFGVTSKFPLFLKEVPPKFEVIPDKGERRILQDYIKYLDNNDPKIATKITSSLKKKALSRSKPLSANWISFFEGNSQFCLFSNPNICTYSIESASKERLMPLISDGDKTAIELVLVYSAAVSLDGAEAESIGEYQSIIKKKHAALIEEVEVKNKDFFRKMPINWIEGT